MRKVMTFLKEAAIVVKEQPGGMLCDPGAGLCFGSYA